MDIYIKEYTSAPGGRFIKEGKFSGEDFRIKYLEPQFEQDSVEKINIFLDDTEGYPSSFLEEAFGGLVRKVKDKDLVKRRLNFVSEDKILIKEVSNCIEEA